MLAADGDRTLEDVRADAVHDPRELARLEPERVGVWGSRGRGRRETASGYLKAAGVVVRGCGRPSTSPAKPVSEARAHVASTLGLSPEDLREGTPGSRTSRFSNNVSWAASGHAPSSTRPAWS